MISWKNLLENLAIVVIMFLGLGIYTKMVLTPTLVEAIRTETTKVENNIDTKIDNKFKKIDELTSNLPQMISPSTTATTTTAPDASNAPAQSATCKDGEVCVPVSTLSRKQKKHLGWL